MTKTYHISGMNCGGCAAKLQKHLSAVDAITSVVVDKPTDSATMSFARDVTVDELNRVVAELDPKYSVSAQSLPQEEVADRTWLEIYRPILLIFFYISGVCILAEYVTGHWDWMRYMRHFMAGFFIVFSFFKLLNVDGFAESYRMYDIVAAKLPIWGYIYPFVELLLGVAFLLNYEMLSISVITLVVMSVSIIGVLRSVLNRQKIQCACLGAVFDLPMSTVTIIEDALMIVMSAWMIFNYL